MTNPSNPSPSPVGYEAGIPTEQLRQTLELPIYSFAPKEIADLYTSSFALQFNTFYPSLTPDDQDQLEATYSRSAASIVAAGIDALSREIISAVEGGTVNNEPINEDEAITSLTASLDTPDNPYLAEAKKAGADTAMRRTGHYSVERFYGNMTIGMTLAGIRIKLLQVIENGMNFEEIKQLASDTGTITETIFAAKLRHPQPGTKSNDHWQKFSTFVRTFGEATDINRSMLSIDNIVTAQHGNDHTKGSMLLRTSSDPTLAKELLDAKDSEQTTAQLENYASPELLTVVRKYPKLNLFATVS